MTMFLEVLMYDRHYCMYNLQDGWTPLMTASFEGHVEIVRILIEAKAHINSQNEVCCSYHQKTHYTTHHNNCVCS